MCVFFFVCVCVPFPSDALGGIWNSTLSFPDYCPFIYFVRGMFVLKFGNMLINAEETNQCLVPMELSVMSKMQNSIHTPC